MFKESNFYRILFTRINNLPAHHASVLLCFTRSLLKDRSIGIDTMRSRILSAPQEKQELIYIFVRALSANVTAPCK